MGKKKDPWDWLKEYTATLVGLGERFKGTGPVLEYGAYTILKLISVRYYAGTFTKIATGKSAKTWNYDGAVYIDLFSGPGVVRIRETGDFVVGSPIAATLVDPRFDYSVFVENDAERCRVLEERVKSFLPNDKFKVFHGDCNEKIDKVIHEITSRFKKPIVLVFVDPEGMEVKWATMERLSSAFRSLDFMINLTVGVGRVGAKIESGGEEYEHIFSDFFGEKAPLILLESGSAATVEQTYVTRVRNVLGRPIGENIPIFNRGNQKMYSILAYTRRSSTGSPWAKAFQTLREKIANFNGTKVRQILDIIKHRSTQLRDYV